MSLKQLHHKKKITYPRLYGSKQVSCLKKVRPENTVVVTFLTSRYCAPLNFG